MSLKAGTASHLAFVIPQVQLLAATPIDLVAPADGYVTGLTLIVDTAVTTGGTVKPQIGTTDVPGVLATVANAATKGTLAVATDPTPSAPGRFVAKGGRIRIVPAGFATAGVLNGVLFFNSADVSPA